MKTQNSTIPLQDDDVELHVLRCRVDILGANWFNVVLRPQEPYGSYGWKAQDGHLDFHTAPEL